MSPPEKKKKLENILVGGREDEKADPAGFREKKRFTRGVVDYLFKPKDNQAYNFSKLEVIKEWPARMKQLIKVHPTGSPDYQPGSHLHFNVVVASHCYMRFTVNTLCAILGLVMNSVPAAAGAAPTLERLFPLKKRVPAPAEGAQAAREEEEDFDTEVDPDDEPDFDPAHLFIPESPSGLVLATVDRIEVMVHNTVAKVFEISGHALQRYHAFSNRTAGEDFGPDMDTTAINYFVPTVDRDVSATKPSRDLLEFAREFRKDKNEKFLSHADLYGYPFLYDPVIKQLHDLKDFLSHEFGPGTHIEIRIFLAPDFGKGLRALGATKELTTAQRTALWARKPRVKIDTIWLTMERQMYPPGSAFLKNMDAEFAKFGGRLYPFTNPNDLRHPVTPSLTEQTWPINLHLIGYPTILYIYFDTSANLEGIDGFTANTTVSKFPTNLESLDVTYQDQSLLPGGELTKLDLPSLDTHNKLYFYEHQKKFRRFPGTYDDFFDNGVQQYVVFDLSHLYLQDAKMADLDYLKLTMKFNNRLSPEGWQIGLLPVNEKLFDLKPTGEHLITNSAGKQQIQA